MKKDLLSIMKIILIYPVFVKITLGGFEVSAKLSNGDVPTGKPKPGIILFVSCEGNDKNPGTIKKPFRTIEKARDIIREIKEPIEENILVYLRGGKYFLSKTLEFDERDCGKNGFYSIYKSYNDEKVMISGGKEIKNWSPSGNGIYKTKFDGPNFRQLYVNGKRAIRARSPKKGKFYRLKFWNYKDREIVIDSSLITKWNNFDQVEMIVQMHWAEGIMRLSSYKLFNEYAYLSVQNPERDLVFIRDNPIKAENESFHFENALEFLDEPGEWYFDNSTKTIYYKPLEGEDPNTSEIFAPQIETLIKINGTADKQVHHLKFNGITFSHSTWLQAGKTGLLDAQAGQYTIRAAVNNIQFVNRPTSAIYLSFAHDIIFERNQLVHLGATGLDLHYGTHDNSIIGNIFSDISGNGISVAKFADPDVNLGVPYNPVDEREICRNDTIRNNLVTKTGEDYYSCCGIACGYPSGIVIEHNEVYDMPYTGISVGWGWIDADNAMRKNQIRKNHIFNVLKLLCDGGGIYTLSRQPDSYISENYIHDIYRSEWAVGSLNNGIFLDQGSSGITLQKNVIKNVPQGNVRHNITGKIIYIDNETSDQKIIDDAGLEKEYLDLKTLMKNY